MKKLTSILFVIAGISVGLIGFQNCSPLRSNNGSDVGADLNSFGNEDAPGGNGEIVALSDTRTASIVRANRTLDNLVSCLGTGTASQAAQEEFQAQRDALSSEGDANSITATMFVSFEKVAAEVCSQLINQESAQAANQRRIFNQVDFNQGQSNAGNAAIADVTRRLARSCWGRNESSEELNMVQQNTQAAFQNAADNANETVNKMIFVCTAMATSFATVGM